MRTFRVQAKENGRWRNVGDTYRSVGRAVDEARERERLECALTPIDEPVDWQVVDDKGRVYGWDYAGRMIIQGDTGWTRA